MSEVILPPFKRHLVYGKVLKCLPVEWGDKQGQIIPNQTFGRKVSIRIWIILHGLYVAFQIANLSIGGHALADKLVGGLILSLYLCFFGMRLELVPDLVPIGNLNKVCLGVGKNLIDSFFGNNSNAIILLTRFAANVKEILDGCPKNVFRLSRSLLLGCDHRFDGNDGIHAV